MASEKEARRLVRERSGGVCEICGSQKATNYQHRKARGQGGPWTASNGIDVCGMGNAFGCHGYLHQNPALACEAGWTVKSWGDEKAVPAQLVHGVVLLDDEGGFEVLDV
jgi:hypothetical protein